MSRGGLRIFASITHISILFAFIADYIPPRKPLWHGVVPVGFAPWMTAQNAAHAKNKPFDSTVALKCFERICGAAWMKTAALAEQGGNGVPIKPDRRHDNLSHKIAQIIAERPHDQPLFCSLSPCKYPSFPRHQIRSFFRVAYGRMAVSGRPIRTISISSARCAGKTS